MNEIKAYIRTEKVNDVIESLEEMGLTGVTVIDVMALGPGLIDESRAKYSMEYVERYSRVAKLELICSGEAVETIIGIIRENAYTGGAGDGLIAVSEVQNVVKIRSGRADEEALDCVTGDR